MLLQGLNGKMSVECFVECLAWPLQPLLMRDLNIKEGYPHCFQHKPLCIKHVLPHLLLVGLQDGSGFGRATNSVTPASWGPMEKGRHKVSQGKVWDMNWKENLKPVAFSASIKWRESLMEERVILRTPITFRLNLWPLLDDLPRI